jgi:DNA-directed RNA polymerase subunit RPC12/RpoP
MSKKGSNPRPPKGMVKPTPPPNPPKPVNIWEEDSSPREFTHRCAMGKASAYDGSECVYCHSRNILATEQVQADGDAGTQAIECHDCGRTWYDLWKLDGWMEAP